LELRFLLKQNAVQLPEPRMELMIGLEPTTYALPRHIQAAIFSGLYDLLTGI